MQKLTEKIGDMEVQAQKQLNEEQVEKMKK